MNRSSPLYLRAHGPFACFTRPEFKTERVSYEVPTPSAVRGIFESVLWKPAIAWQVDRISVLRPIQFISLRRNEVRRRATVPSASIMKGGGDYRHFCIEEEHTQRNTLALKEVDYVFEAHLTLTRKAGVEDNIRKFEEMFRRRLKSGQCFQQPYFGCREFPAFVEPPQQAPAPIDDTRELGFMLWDICFGAPNVPLFYKALMNKGKITIPANPEWSV